MLERIRQILERNGLTHISKDKEAPLSPDGLDSLMLALLIIELEREFQLKIPVIPLAKERFSTLGHIEHYLIELGAK